MIWTKSTEITITSGYRDITLGGTELEELMSLRFLRLILDSKFTFEAHLRKVVSKAARSLGCRALGTKVI